ncbi:two-component system response regulator YesN [Clostridium algifaecis]|uniref:Stage 0 sporulation protein A homolog n=1 Tax=Clostridium algifaecis TaxID=1472040 RepID=A0ABS4KPL2_9CLOT|nr:response regulator [Clostridium algifaecis]MBP2031977.1 two-component system response regulator YesN [Clostridium algifaecis]
MYKVLIVDDDKVSRYILRRYKKWNKFNFSIEGEACDGKEALKKLTVLKINLVITDIRMPGMNGIEFLSEIKKTKYNNICVILLSTYSDFEYAKQGIRLGAFDYITKPINDKMLDEALKRAEMYLDKNVIEEEKKSLEENITSYYSKNSFNELLLLITAGDYEAIVEGQKLFKNISYIRDNNLLKIELVFNNLLLRLQEEIFEIWPWLKFFQNIIVDETIVSSESIEKIETGFIENIKNMVQLVRKFELHQTDSLIKITCEYILQHIEEKISLEKISIETHTSKDYIGKLFKQATGYNLKQYVINVKMEHAKYLIKLGYYKNYEVCDKLGYSSVDYFCRLFKNYTGYTPMEFRKVI